MSVDYIWYNKTTGAYAVSSAAIKGRYLVTYFIAVIGADKKFWSSWVSTNVQFQGKSLAQFGEGQLMSFVF